MDTLIISQLSPVKREITRLSIPKGTDHLTVGDIYAEAVKAFCGVTLKDMINSDGDSQSSCFWYQLNGAEVCFQFEVQGE